MKLNWRKWLFVVVVLPISRLPRGVRYVLSDAATWVLEHLVKYRRGVIDHNLRLAFPEKSEGERGQIRCEFYRHFADVALEQTAMFSASRELVLENSRILNPEIFDSYARDGRPVILCAGHHNNFEMCAASVAMQIPVPAAGIYAPLANKYFDERIRETRELCGLHLWPRSSAMENTQRWHDTESSYVVLFAFDQSPAAAQGKVWVPFFGRPTAATVGLEVFARKFGAAVIFGWIRRVERGRYEIEFEEVTQTADAGEFGWLVAEVHARLEAVIRRDPVPWLWSHRRWKLSLADYAAGEETVLMNP